MLSSSNLRIKPEEEKEETRRWRTGGQWRGRREEEKKEREPTAQLLCLGSHHKYPGNVFSYFCMESVVLHVLYPVLTRCTVDAPENSFILDPIPSNSIKNTTQTTFLFAFDCHHSDAPYPLSCILSMNSRSFQVFDNNWSQSSCFGCRQL